MSPSYSFKELIRSGDGVKQGWAAGITTVCNSISLIKTCICGAHTETLPHNNGNFMTSPPR
jgi:hypothetical protein